MNLDLEAQSDLSKGFLDLTLKARLKVGELDLRNTARFYLVQDA